MLPSSRRNPRFLPLLVMALLGVFSASAAAPARAQETPAAERQLTSRGRWLLGGSVGGSWSGDRSGTVGTLDAWSVYGWPSVDYLVRDRIGVGLLFGGSRSVSLYGQPGTYRTSFSQNDLITGLRADFDLPLSSRLSILFRPSLNYVNMWIRTSGWRAFLAPASSDDFERLHAFTAAVALRIIRPALQAHLLVRLSSAIGISFGPDVWLDFIIDDDGLRKAQSRFYEKPGKTVRVQAGLTAGVLLSL